VKILNIYIGNYENFWLSVIEKNNKRFFNLIKQDINLKEYISILYKYMTVENENCHINIFINDMNNLNCSLRNKFKHNSNKKLLLLKKKNIKIKISRDKFCNKINNICKLGKINYENNINNINKLNFKQEQIFNVITKYNKTTNIMGYICGQNIIKNNVFEKHVCKFNISDFNNINFILLNNISKKYNKFIINTDNEILKDMINFFSGLRIDLKLLSNNSTTINGLFKLRNNIIYATNENNKNIEFIKKELSVQQYLDNNTENFNDTISNMKLTINPTKNNIGNIKKIYNNFNYNTYDVLFTNHFMIRYIERIYKSHNYDYYINNFNSDIINNLEVMFKDMKLLYYGRLDDSEFNRNYFMINGWLIITSKFIIKRNGDVYIKVITLFELMDENVNYKEKLMLLYNKIIKCKKDSDDYDFYNRKIYDILLKIKKNSWKLKKRYDININDILSNNNFEIKKNCKSKKKKKRNIRVKTMGGETYNVKTKKLKHY
jgi:hypothetical protein